MHVPVCAHCVALLLGPLEHDLKLSSDHVALIVFCFFPAGVAMSSAPQVRQTWKPRAPHSTAVRIPVPDGRSRSPTTSASACWSYYLCTNVKQIIARRSCPACDGRVLRVSFRFPGSPPPPQATCPFYGDATSHCAHSGVQFVHTRSLALIVNLRSGESCHTRHSLLFSSHSSHTACT